MIQLARPMVREISVVSGYVERFGTPKHPRDLEEHHRVVNYLTARTGRDVPMRFSDKQRPVEITAGTSCGSTRATPT